MHNRNIILAMLNVLLIISVAGELIALYTGQFEYNRIPFATHFYNLVLVGMIVFYSIEPKKRTRIEYLPLNTKLTNKVQNSAEKYYIHASKQPYNTPDTEEIWITPSKQKKFSDTCDFDETTINNIKAARYKDAAIYLNSLQKE